MKCKILCFFISVLLCISSCSPRKTSPDRTDTFYSDVSTSTNTKKKPILVKSSTITEWDFFDGKVPEPELKPWKCPEAWRSIQNSSAENHLWCIPPASWNISGSPAILPEWACPEGYYKRIDPELKNIHWCDPRPVNIYKNPVSPACKENEIWYPTLGDSCVHIGPECPVGNFPENLPPENLPNDKKIIYVLSGSDNGSGTKENPYNTITEAIQKAKDFDIIAIGKGNYNESITIEKPISLIGACVDETKIEPLKQSTNTYESIIKISEQGNISIENLTLAGKRIGIFIIDADEPVLFKNIHITNTQGDSLLSMFSNIQLENISIGNNTANAQEYHEVGILADKGSQIQLKNTMIYNSSVAGLIIVDDKKLSVQQKRTAVLGENIYINNTIGSSVNQKDGQGIYITDGIASLQNVLIENSHTDGILVSGENSIFDGKNIIISHTQPNIINGTTTLASGFVQLAGVVSLENTFIDNNIGCGIFLPSFDNTGTLIQEKSIRSFSAKNLFVYNTQSNTQTHTFGIGMFIGNDTNMQIDHAVFVNNRETSILVGDYNQVENHDNNITFTGKNIFIIYTQSNNIFAEDGVGISILNGNVNLENVSIEQNANLGIAVSTPFSHLTAKNVKIYDTVGLDENYGVGMKFVLGATGNLENIFLDKNKTAGMVFQSPETKVTAKNIIITNTKSRTNKEAGGQGIQVSDEAYVEIDNLLLDNNEYISFIATGKNTVLNVAHAVIINTKPFSGAFDSGVGISVTQQAKGNISQSFISDNQFYGIYSENAVIQIDETYIQNTLEDHIYHLAGIGVGVTDGSVANIHKTIIKNNKTSGIWVVSNQSHLEGSHIVIRDTQSQVSDNFFGQGILVSENASAQLTNVKLTDNRFASIMLDDNGSMDAKNIFIENTLDQSCKDLSEPCDFEVGHGVFLSQSKLTLNNFIIKNNNLTGIYLVNNSTITVENGMIQNNPIGINIFEMDNKFSLEKNFENVFFIDNINNLDTQDLPMPDFSGVGLTK